MTSTNSPSATCNVVAAACPASNSSTLAAFVTSSKSPRHNAPVVAGPLHIDQADTHVVRADLELHVEHLNGHRHLPLFTLRAAA